MILNKIFFLLLFFSGALLGELYDPITVYLTWQRSPESTMVIRWMTHPVDQKNLIEYQEEGVEAWQSSIGHHTQLPGKSPYLLHTVELTQLQPNTCYRFRTGAEGVIYKFQTMPAGANEEIRFVAGGDVYHDDMSFVHATNVQAAKKSPHFALIGGDIAYASLDKVSPLPKWMQELTGGVKQQTIDRWLAWLVAWKEDMVTPRGCLIPLLPTIGNHDTDGRYGQTPVQAPFFYALFAMPGSAGYNVLDFGSDQGIPYMSIFLLDSDHTHSVNGMQRRWLALTLERRRAVTHKFALYHVPAYPSYRDYDNVNCAKVRRSWVPLFEKYHLTAAFENHDHQYKRTHPLLRGKINPEGIRYFGDGAWGIKNPRKLNDPSKKWYLAKTVSSRHFLYVVLQADKKSVSAINPEGVLLDQISW